jgi:hypothetical protein
MSTIQEMVEPRSSRQYHLRVLRTCVNATNAGSVRLAQERIVIRANDYVQEERLETFDDLYVAWESESASEE